MLSVNLVLSRKFCKKRIVFWKNLHSWHEFYMTAGCGGRDKSQL